MSGGRGDGPLVKVGEKGGKRAMSSILVERGGGIIVSSSPTKQLRVNWKGGQESLWLAFTDRGWTNLYSQRGFSDTSVSKHCNSPAIHIVLQVRGEEKKRGVVRTAGGENVGWVPVKVDLKVR